MTRQYMTFIGNDIDCFNRLGLQKSNLKFHLPYQDYKDFVKSASSATKINDYTFRELCDESCFNHKIHPDSVEYFHDIKNDICFFYDTQTDIHYIYARR